MNYPVHTIPKDRWKILTTEIGASTMNHSTTVFIANPDVRALRVSYEENSCKEKEDKYVFKTFDKNIKIDDYVVIPTDTRHNMTVGKVIEVDVDINFDSSHEFKWIIDRVNKKPYEEVLLQEQIIIKEVRTIEFTHKRQQLQSALGMNDPEKLKALPINIIAEEK